MATKYMILQPVLEARYLQTLDARDARAPNEGASQNLQSDVDFAHELLMDAIQQVLAFTGKMHLNSVNHPNDALTIELCNQFHAVDGKPLVAYVNVSIEHR
jgi:hypothetical protein